MRVLFDLDGTLADTAPDLCHALNAVLAEHAMAPLPLARVRPAASHGAVAMLRLAFPDMNDAAMAPLRESFITHYRANLVRETCLFPGTLDLLAGLEQRGLAWGIVTNKLAHLSTPLLEALQLSRRAACAVYGDTTPHAKPHPAPLLHACELLGCRPEQAVYVGDSTRDVEAAQRAGMPVVLAAWGYLDGVDDTRDWGVDHVIHRPQDLLHWERLAGRIP